VWGKKRKSLREKDRDPRWGVGDTMTNEDRSLEKDTDRCDREWRGQKERFRGVEGD
jgi:hypothetical protein